MAFDSARVRAVTVKPASSSAWTTAGPRFPLPYPSIECQLLLFIFWKSKKVEVGHTPITATFLIDILDGWLKNRYNKMLITGTRIADRELYRKANILAPLRIRMAIYSQWIAGGCSAPLWELSQPDAGLLIGNIMPVGSGSIV